MSRTCLKLLLLFLACFVTGALPAQEPVKLYSSKDIAAVPADAKRIEFGYAPSKADVAALKKCTQLNFLVLICGADVDDVLAAVPDLESLI